MLWPLIHCLSANLRPEGLFFSVVVLELVSSGLEAKSAGLGLGLGLAFKQDQDLINFYCAISAIKL